MADGQPPLPKPFEIRDRFNLYFEEEVGRPPTAEETIAMSIGANAFADIFLEAQGITPPPWPVPE